jgi:membrane-associated protein
MSDAISVWIHTLPFELLLLVPLLAFLEACFVVGLFVSGIFLLSTASLVYAQGETGLLQIVMLAFIGAMAGDHTGYYFGAKAAPGLWRFRWVRRQIIKRKVVYRKSYSALQRSAPLAICVGRLIPAVRSITPVIAAGAGVTPRQFFVYDFLACTIWGTGLALLVSGINFF